MISKPIILIIVLFLMIPISFAADDAYKPYLHKATVPEHPDIKLYSQYSTSLFPGAATYSYPIEVPKGTNNLQPNVAIAYNSQTVKQRPGILGAGWVLNSHSFIYRDVNASADNVSDDEFILVLDGNLHKLIYNPTDDLWHTEIESYFKIQNISGGLGSYDQYWVLTKKDGTEYRFGYNADSELVSNIYSYVVKWNIDLIEDVHGNGIYYSYLEDPFDEDNGTVYLDKIEYNNDRQRKIEFNYESDQRPDNRIVYEQGNKLDESRRLKDLSVYADDNLVRRYNINYVNLNPALSSISSINLYGSDNNSILHNVTFEYSSHIIGYKKISDYAPPYYFTDGDHLDFGLRLIDVNNDGFVDMVRGDGYDAVKKVWINNQKSNWTENYDWKFPLNIVDDSIGRIDEVVRFGDVNGDGFIDILRSKKGGRYIYLNNGSGWYDASSEWDIPFDFVDENQVDLGVRLADVNGDGRVDLVKARNSRYVYLNNGTGGWNGPFWTVPVRVVDDGSNDQGVRIVDLNGDGLPDIIKGKDGNRNAWLNNGAGWSNATSFTPPIDFITAPKSDNGVRFADINNDGLTDLLVDYKNDTNTDKRAWINNGTGWISNDTWQAPEAFTADGYNVGRRLADVNGDGFVDLVVAEAGNDWYVRTKNYSIPYLLTNITNELGGFTSINYSSSTKFNNTNSSGDSELGFNMFVVSSVETNNSMNPDFNIFSNISYNYTGGKYDYKKQEFKGFNLVVENNPFSIIEHYFHQDDARKGKEYETIVYDTNKDIYSKNEKKYNYSRFNDIYNVSLKYSTDYLYDGVLANPTITNKSYKYDLYGNLLFVSNYGDVSVSDDEKFINYSYYYNENDWILDKVSSVTLYDSDFDKVKETRYYYDDSLINLEKTEKWNSDGNNSFRYFEYDSYGNIILQTDSLGNSMKYSYDSTYTYPTSVLNALNHITHYSYDLGTGNLNYEEKNGIKKRYEYDTFGRISKEIMPYDTSSSPTKEYSYNFTGNAPESVKILLKTTANKTNSISYYYDGFANLVQIKTDIEKNKQIVKNLFYDDNYRISSEQNPYFADYNDGISSVSNFTNYTNYTYDSLDRVMGVLNPDSTSKNVTFDHYNITDYDENGNRHVYSLDAHGRIIRVYEFNTNDVGIDETYKTSYSYDTNDNLIKITDNLGNEFSFEYDSLSRKISMNDPDLGLWNYSYDTNGNLIKQIDARGEKISLYYDALNRIISKNSSDVNISFSYDKDYYGTLSNLTMNDISFSYEYDDRLRVVKEIKEIDGVDFSTSFIYDSQDRLISKQGFTDIDYIFNKQGKVEKIPGFISDSSFNAFGSMLNRTYNNNLIQYFDYNSSNNRLLSIGIPNVQNLTYSYDKVGNIMSITDVISGNNHNLTYDNLDRLTSATIGSDRYVYSFNSLGNIMKIVKNNDSKKFVYNGNQTHAPSTIIEGDAGVDVYNPSELDTGNKNRTFEFFLVNDKETSLTGANWSIDFGDGNSFSNQSISIENHIWMLVQNNYSSGGSYSVNVSAVSDGISDEESLDIKFGARAQDLDILSSNITENIFEFEIYNDIEETIENITWNCSDGINSIYAANLTRNESLYDYIQHNYTTSGEKIFACTAVSNDGSETQELVISIKALEIENYTRTTVNGTTQQIEFIIKNYWYNLENIQYTIDTDGQQFTDFVNLTNLESTVIAQNITYSTDGSKEINITITSGSISDDIYESFVLEGVLIEDYTRLNYNYSKKILMFDILNNWNSGAMTWTLSDPSISNTTNLDYNQKLFVFVENNYTTEGDKEPEITATTSSFVDRLKDMFEIKPLKIKSLLTLSEGLNAVSELVVRNNFNSTKLFTWQLDTGEENISSSSINISDNTFIFIESNYSSEGM